MDTLVLGSFGKEMFFINPIYFRPFIGATHVTPLITTCDGAHLVVTSTFSLFRCAMGGLLDTKTKTQWRVQKQNSEFGGSFSPSVMAGQPTPP